MPGITSKYPAGVQRLNVDTPLEDVLHLLKRDGGVVIKSYVTQAVIDQAYKEILPRLEQDKPWDGAFFPGETRRAPGMNAYSPTYTDEMLMHPLYQSVVNHFLCTSNSFWGGEDRRAHVSYPQVSACTAFQVGPGAKDQQIHRVSSKHLPHSPLVTYQYLTDFRMITSGTTLTLKYQSGRTNET
jgi:hypothetical protein